MVERIERIGDALGVVWTLFEDESGQLTALASVLLAALAFVTAYRCFLAMRPATTEKRPNVVVAGSAFAVIFTSIGCFFLVHAAQRLGG